jgi:hypothetical protein
MQVGTKLQIQTYFIQRTQTIQNDERQQPETPIHGRTHNLSFDRDKQPDIGATEGIPQDNYVLTYPLTIPQS